MLILFSKTTKPTDLSKYRGLGIFHFGSSGDAHRHLDGNGIIFSSGHHIPINATFDKIQSRLNSAPAIALGAVLKGGQVIAHAIVFKRDDHFFGMAGE